MRKVRRSAPALRAQRRHRLGLHLAVAGAGGKDRAAERARAEVQDEAARRHVIGERIVDHVARPETGGKQRARRAPGIGPGALRLEHRARRHEHPFRRPADRREPAEGRFGLLRRHQLRLPEDGKLRQFGARGDASRIHPVEMGGKARRGGHRLCQMSRKTAEKLGFALLGGARLTLVEDISHGDVSVLPRPFEYFNGFIEFPSNARRISRKCQQTDEKPGPPRRFVRPGHKDSLSPPRGIRNRPDRPARHRSRSPTAGPDGRRGQDRPASPCRHRREARSGTRR